MSAKYSSNFKAKDILLNPTFLGPVAAATVGLGVSALHNAVSKHQEAKAHASAYKEMLALHPTLRARPEQSVRLLHRSLSNVNPVMARDPLVAGAWVDNIIEQNASLGPEASNQALIGAVKDMAQIRSHVSGAVKSEHGMRPSYGPAAHDLVAKGFAGAADVVADKRDSQARIDKFYAGERAKRLEAISKRIDDEHGKGYGWANSTPPPLP